MNPKEELTKLLMDSYDKGIKDAKQAAIIALEETVAVMVAQEREACAKVCESYLSESPYSWGGTTMAEAIRARGTT